MGMGIEVIQKVCLDFRRCRRAAFVAARPLFPEFLTGYPKRAGGEESHTNPTLKHVRCRGWHHAQKGHVGIVVNVG